MATQPRENLSSDTPPPPTISPSSISSLLMPNPPATSTRGRTHDLESLRVRELAEQLADAERRLTDQEQCSLEMVTALSDELRSVTTELDAQSRMYSNRVKLLQEAAAEMVSRIAPLNRRLSETRNLPETAQVAESLANTALLASPPRTSASTDTPPNPVQDLPRAVQFVGSVAEAADAAVRYLDDERRTLLRRGEHAEARSAELARELQDWVGRVRTLEAELGSRGRQVDVQRADQDKAERELREERQRLQSEVAASAGKLSQLQAALDVERAALRDSEEKRRQLEERVAQEPESSRQERNHLASRYGELESEMRAALHDKEQFAERAQIAESQLLEREDELRRQGQTLHQLGEEVRKLQAQSDRIQRERDTLADRVGQLGERLAVECRNSSDHLCQHQLEKLDFSERLARLEVQFGWEIELGRCWAKRCRSAEWIHRQATYECQRAQDRHAALEQAYERLKADLAAEAARCAELDHELEAERRGSGRLSAQLRQLKEGVAPPLESADSRQYQEILRLEQERTAALEEQLLAGDVERQKLLRRLEEEVGRRLKSEMQLEAVTEKQRADRVVERQEWLVQIEDARQREREEWSGRLEQAVTRERTALESAQRHYQEELARVQAELLASARRQKEEERELHETIRGLERRRAEEAIALAQVQAQAQVQREVQRERAIEKRDAAEQTNPTTEAPVPVPQPSVAESPARTLDMTASHEGNSNALQAPKYLPSNVADLGLEELLECMHVQKAALDEARRSADIHQANVQQLSRILRAYMSSNRTAMAREQQLQLSRHRMAEERFRRVALAVLGDESEQQPLQLQQQQQLQAKSSSAILAQQQPVVAATFNTPGSHGSSPRPGSPSSPLSPSAGREHPSTISPLAERTNIPSFALQPSPVRVRGRSGSDGAGPVLGNIVHNRTAYAQTPVAKHQSFISPGPSPHQPVARGGHTPAAQKRRPLLALTPVEEPLGDENDMEAHAESRYVTAQQAAHNKVPHAQPKPVLKRSNSAPKALWPQYQPKAQAPRNPAAAPIASPASLSLASPPMSPSKDGAAIGRADVLSLTGGGLTSSVSQRLLQHAVVGANNLTYV